MCVYLFPVQNLNLQSPYTLVLFFKWKEKGVYDGEKRYSSGAWGTPPEADTTLLESVAITISLKNEGTLNVSSNNENVMSGVYSKNIQASAENTVVYSLKNTASGYSVHYDTLQNKISYSGGYVISATGGSISYSVFLDQR